MSTVTVGELRPCLQKHHGTFWKPNGLNPSFGVRSEFSGGTFGKPVIGRSHVLYDGSMPAEIPRSAILRLFFGWCGAKVEDAQVICRTLHLKGSGCSLIEQQRGMPAQFFLDPSTNPHHCPGMQWMRYIVMHPNFNIFLICLL